MQARARKQVVNLLCYLFRATHLRKVVVKNYDSGHSLTSLQRQMHELLAHHARPPCSGLRVDRLEARNESMYRKISQYMLARVHGKTGAQISPLQNGRNAINQFFFIAERH